MKTSSLKYLIPAFFIILSCSTSGGKESVSLFNRSQGKIDPALETEVEKLESRPDGNPPIEVLIRTRTTIDAAQKRAIEEKGGKIGAALGDVMTATIPARSLSEVGSLPFVVYIEKAKKERLR